jgi:hypothetical protein
VAACTIFLGGSFGKGIAYSSGEASQRNSFNESLSVENDDQKLFLVSLVSMGMMALYGQNKEKKLTFEGGAEHLWATFIRPLQG